MKTILTEEDIDLIRNSKQEITAGEALTHENLQKFINSGLAGATVADLVKYFEAIIAKKMEEREREIKALISYSVLMNTIFNGLYLYGILLILTYDTGNKKDRRCN